MAKKFAGFKPETLTNKILPALGYSGPTDEKSINQFLAANPAAAAKMGKYTMAARQMVEGRPIEANKGYSASKGTGPGGSYKPSDLNIKVTKPKQKNAIKDFNRRPQNQKTAANHQAAIRDFSKSLGRQDDKNTTAVTINNDIRANQKNKQLAQDNNNNLPDAVAQVIVYGPDGTAYPNPQAARDAGVTNFTYTKPTFASDTGSTTAANGAMLSGKEMTRQIQADPTASVTRANVVANEGDARRLIADGVGQAGDAAQAQLTLAGPAQQADMPEQMDAATVDPTMSQADVAAATADMQAAQGEVSDQAQVTAQQLDPRELAALDLEAAQLDQAQTVDAPAALQATPDQLISEDPTVNQKQVEETLALSQAASVQDELAGLMDDFSARGDTPPWAAGAMRAANAAMAARGLSASSMAGMAVVQAAMESALPIAQMDAANKQEMAMEKARQRANFMGLEFDQRFQTKVKNAARISEIANLNFSAEQTIALENARMAQTVDLDNLSNRQAKVMADAAIMSQTDLSNLDNRQRAAVQNAQSFLQMDMANLDNEQQNTMFRHQANINSIFSDQAATNAAAQFNATSENQTNQFFANLASVVSQFNAEQSNAMSRFNAGEANALAQFNASQINARDQFNAQNHLIVEQANAKWLQSVTTNENAANNQANRDATMAANQLTMTAYNNIIQQERDIMGWAWRSGENAKQRENAIVTAKIAAAADGSDGGSNAFETGLGEFAAELFSRGLDYIFPI